MADLETLVARMQWGDISAFEEFARSYWERIYALAFSLSGNRADAEDLTQEILLKLYRDFPKYARRPGSLDAFIYRMAVNLWVGWVRRRKRHPTFSLEEAPFEPDDPEADPEKVLQKEYWRAVWKAWGELPEHYRLLLKLRVADGLSYREIAAAVGETEAAVKCKVSRGRTLLRQKLKESGFDAPG
jgi:RNA polymerase sigma-70 factor (ECF subfamily)